MIERERERERGYEKTLSILQIKSLSQDRTNVLDNFLVVRSTIFFFLSTSLLC